MIIGKALQTLGIIKAGSLVVTSTQVIQRGNGVGQIPKGVKVIDIFAVGAGGGGGGDTTRETGEYNWLCNYAGAGAGAYVATLLRVQIDKADVLLATIGAGGQAGDDGYYSWYDGKSHEDAVAEEGNSGGTSYFSKNGTILSSAAGGNGGGKSTGSTDASSGTGRGANGGTGGGGGGYEKYVESTEKYSGTGGGYGGQNGGSGYTGKRAGGSGDGLSKYAFGETSNILVADGGDSDGHDSKKGSKPLTSSNYGRGGNNASRGYNGAVIIRWNKGGK